MTKADAFFLLLTLVMSSAANAQPRFNLSLGPTLRGDQSQSVSLGERLAMPVGEPAVAQGPVKPPRGVIAGFQLAPNASFGLGIFEGQPKRRIGAIDPSVPERKSKRAAVGFSLKF